VNDPYVKAWVEDGVGHLQLNRPDKANALLPESMTLMENALAEWVPLSGVRSILLSAAGRNFCAGRDLSQPVPPGRAGATIEAEFNPLIRLLYRYPKPVVAKVAGAAAGGGVGIALAADITVAADDSRFVFPFGQLGSVADCGIHLHLSRRLGDAVARRILLLGEELSGAEAAGLGLIAKSVPAEALDETVDGIIDRLRQGATKALEETLTILDYVHTMNMTAAVLAEAQAAQRVSETKDHAEGVRSFTEHRSPVFTGM
jgi:2-(1,2-epoxy-1,2-dihydrophenyl)acetyl-CoA isomerase